MARSKKHSINTKKVKPLAENEGALSRDKIEVGDFFQLIIFFVRLLVVYLQVMGGSQVIFVSKEVPFITMLLLVWFGLKIKSL